MSVDRSIGDTTSMFLRGYGPLVALIALLALITTLAPSRGAEEIVSSTTGGSSGSREIGSAGGVIAGSKGTTVAGTATGGANTGPCTDRPKQVPGDPYSPPCVAFSGDNGGSTYRGVDAKTIKVTYRLTSDPSIQDAIASVGGGDALDSPEAVERTAYGLIDYFNSRFQFYGRKIKLIPFQGRGQLTTEILGGGQDAANNDAIKVAKEVGPFGDISAISQPYSDALSREKVMAFGAPYMSREWFTQRRPYTWSITPDCTKLTELIVGYGIKRIFGFPADWAGGSLKGRPRKVGFLAPDNPVYQECADHGEKMLNDAGYHFADRQSYTLDIASLSSQAASLVAKFSNEGITSIVCACDPILPIFMTAKAHEQSWTPEWLVTGTALTDVDIVGQFYDQDEWTHAFGLSALGALEPLRGSFGYQAYKSVRKDEPALIVDILYYSFYILALGIQLAGPDLNPETFEKGMFAYPGGYGIAGRWKFGPGDYTPMEDAREIWWDPNALSVQNGKAGAYRQGIAGRYTAGTWPRGKPQVFK